jgi:hypothetical protein
MKYEAKFWLKLLHKVEQYLPRKFVNIGASSRPHPWQIRPLWHKDNKAKYGEWRGVISAGLVNCLPAYVKMKYGEAPQQAKARIILQAIEDLAKKKSTGENGKETKSTIPKPDELVKIYLDENAEIKFHWRKIGSDGSPDSVSGNSNSGGITGVFEKVPDFFKRLGVADANTKILDKPAETQRLLRACDIVLNQPRVGLVNTSDISSAAIDTTLVSINPAFSLPSDREPFLTALAKFTTPEPKNPKFDDLIFQRFIDSPVDQFHLSTVYLLSPVLPLLDKDDLSGWQCYFKYNCHHNLVHAAQQIENRVEFKPLSLIVPLAGGVAQPVINYILAEANFFAQAALDFYQQRKLNGKFYAI